MSQIQTLFKPGNQKHQPRILCTGNIQTDLYKSILLLLIVQDEYNLSMTAQPHQ